MSPEPDPVLEVEGLRIGFAGTAVDLVDGVSLRVDAGRTLAIVGESGCGKSLTALGVMGLLPRPPAQIRGGRARFQGQDLLALSDRQLSDLRGDQLAMIFQEPMSSLNPAFTIGDQIAGAVMRHRRLRRSEARERALEMLRLVRIPAPERRLRAYPHELSGGMRQRAMIAMALANDPRLLIADEPTTALDVTIQAQILALIGRLQAETGTAMILITHDLGVVAEVAHDVAVMYAGQVVEKGPVEAVFDDPQHPYTIGLMGSIPSLGRRGGRLATIAGTVPRVERMPKGCRFVTRCPFAGGPCAAERPPLRPIGPNHAVACFYAPVERKAAA
ncbi:ABC transporter ATP-binding protein [Marinivivus vitaminiproducens]|uniref:ABC transporter ATP-binding protein n=1 Tax=Marinivivus vitaminiproducens TaxID=3035935 RepID=UPI0027A25E96|nr:ABC transporter ATP-binding protein [Geminicoccaceae bacterium SCSIO 64248]